MDCIRDARAKATGFWKARRACAILFLAASFDKLSVSAIQRTNSSKVSTMHAILIAILLAMPLPEGPAPDPLSFSHFPDRLHAFVWRNWELVPAERMARTVGAAPEDIVAIGRAMGLEGPPAITDDQRRRSYISVIRRNWHLLPYDQMLVLLDWTEEHLAYTLREDDFLYIKLGSLKPNAAPLRFEAPDGAAQAGARAIAAHMKAAFPAGVGVPEEPLFAFVDDLSQPPARQELRDVASGFDPRFCYSYFALYGDPLLETEAGPFPDGYLARLKNAGVNGVWLHAVLYKLAPFPWDPALSAQHETRLENLRALVARAKGHGMGIYLYMNEPRAMPVAFFEGRPELKGATAGDYAALCTSAPEVQRYMRESIAAVCRAVPDLAGFFTITASENFTNCWSHHKGGDCPRCGTRPPAEVIAEVNGIIRDGMTSANHAGQLLAWDWGWQDSWAVDAIAALPADVALMSVSEWSIPIQRGGIDSIVGEYSISTIGPGPRATKHWAAARDRGMTTIAKIQAGTTWELGAVPYIPALFNVAEHAARLREADVDGLMLGWTLGGYPSPNLEAVAEMAAGGTVEAALRRVAQRRFGATHAGAVVAAWSQFSTAFGEFPYHGAVVYNAPQHMGPSNLLFAEATGYRATMVGFPYDNLDGWRGAYPAEVFIGQFSAMADGFDSGVETLKGALAAEASAPLEKEISVAEAVAIHYRSVANQARFVLARDRLKDATAETAASLLDELDGLLRDELRLAQRLYAIQSADSRIGFEATNHYFYTPLDLAEKVLNCQYLLENWLPALRESHGP
jgi:hypothetical protein